MAAFHAAYTRTSTRVGGKGESQMRRRKKWTEAETSFLLKERKKERKIEKEGCEGGVSLCVGV